MTQRVIVIEDEAAIVDLVTSSLTKEGFEVTTAEDGVAGLAAARSILPDIIILDITLPKLSGFDICHILRRESRVPIIMLTGRTDDIDRIMGLELGADDYLTKPFSMRELIARMKAILRRTKGVMPDDSQMQIHAGNICMDIGRRMVTIEGRVVHLPLKQFELLRIFMAHQNEVLSRSYLLQSVWDNQTRCDSGTLDVHIRWLREKIESDPGKPRLIRTVRGMGYRLVVDGDEFTG